MDGMDRNQNEIGNEPQWDNTYGKRSLPQVNTSYDAKNTQCEEPKQPGQGQSMAGQISSFGPPVQPYLPPKKNHKKGLFIALGIVLFLLLGCVGAGWFYYINSASYQIKKGFENMDREWAQMRNPLAEKLGADEIAQMMAKDGSHVDTKLDFTVDTYGFGDITLGIDTDYYRDMKRKEMDAKTSFSIMNYDFAHFNLYGDEEVLCFSIPELFMEDIYIETEDVDEQFNRSMWADSYFFGEMEDSYSLNLFPDTSQYEPVHSWQDAREYLGACSDHLETCLKGARMEKAGKGMYRVTFDAIEVNYLLRDLIQTYENMTGQDMYELLSCLQLVSMGENISFLIKMGGAGHIRSIVIEEPVSILDNQIQMEGEILFSGQKRSIDLLQGEIVLTRYEDEEEMEIVWQIDQWISTDKEEYQVEADMKMQAQDEEVNLKYTGAYDAGNDEFEMQLSVKDDWFVYQICGNGKFDDIKYGQSYEMDLQEISMTMDGEELFKISGNIMVEPFEGEIKRSAQAQTAFFKMTEGDWERILDRIDQEYGSLLDLLP